MEIYSRRGESRWRLFKKGCELNIGGMQGDEDRCKLMDNPQGSGASRWVVGGEVGERLLGL